ncbi:MAG: Gfo/Idh/MocA family oxidoreductase, partial [Bacillota bacterium]
RMYTNYVDAVNDDGVDAICISAPVFTHAEIAIAAADAGKHVFCEKPMALSLEEADAMMDAVQKAKVKFQMGFMRRFDAGFLGAKRLIADEAIGDVVLVKSTGRGPGLPGNWYLSFDKSNGLLAEVNSHDFDSIRWLTQGEFVRIYAEAGAFARPDLKEEYPDFFDSAVVSARLSNGTMGVIDGTCPDNYGYDARAEVLGTKGTIFIGQAEEQALVVCHKDGSIRPVVPSWQQRFRQAYIDEMAHFVECVLNDSEPAVTALDGKRALQGVLAANLSLRTGMPVTVDVS